MCHQSCLDFVAAHLTADEASGKDVLEVGARDYNGSPRSIIEEYRPRRYIGVDLQSGPGVDEVCDVGSLLERYPPASFDLVVATEMLEHVGDWRLAIGTLKQLVKAGGILLITTRSVGFGYHGYPYDFWRFDQGDMRALFADLIIEALEDDSSRPGVFLKARKPDTFRQLQFDDYELYSVIVERRVARVCRREMLWFRLRYLLRYASVRAQNLLLRIGRLLGR